MIDKQKFLDLLKNELLQERNKPAKLEAYNRQKEMVKRANKNAQRSLANGEQTVSAAAWQNNPRFDKVDRQYDKYNKVVRANNAAAIEQAGKDFDLANILSNEKLIEENKAFEAKKQAEIEAALDIGAETGDYSEFNKVAEKWNHAVSPIKKATGMNLDEIDPNIDLLSSGNVSRAIYHNFKLANKAKQGVPNVDILVPSNVQNISRKHTTKMANLPYIAKQGLVPNKGGKGFGEVLLGYGADADDIGGVYTTSREPFPKNIESFKNPGDVNEFKENTYAPYESDKITLNIEIPKDKYRRMSRMETNPEEDFVLNFDEDHGSLLQTVQNGGRTDIFEDKIPPQFIKSGTDYNERTKSLEDIIKDYRCNDDCDDWYDALTQTGFVNRNGDWNEAMFDKVFRGKKR